MIRVPIMKTVTVITSTIGRPELRQCIESVRRQTHPNIRHHVYVNGPRWHESARQVLKDFPDVHAVYLPEETGDYGYGTRENPKGSMADVFAAAPFLTRSDWVFFLDDDNWYEPDHVESVMRLAREHDLAWAYTLRRLVGRDGTYLCDDDWCSLGHWPVYGNSDAFLVDNSCFAISRRLAQRVALAWTALPVIADRCVLMALKESGARSGCTGRATVNYRIGLGSAPEEPELYRQIAQRVAREAPEGGYPWRNPAVFG